MREATVSVGVTVRCREPVDHRACKGDEWMNIISKMARQELVVEERRLHLLALAVLSGF